MEAFPMGTFATGMLFRSGYPDFLALSQLEPQILVLALPGKLAEVTTLKGG